MALRRSFRFTALVLSFLTGLGASGAGLAADRANIILITAEDMSPRVGAYGDLLAHTPNIDALAREGVLFRHVFTTAGVCSPSRSSLITGVHQQTLGTMHMRTSSYGEDMEEGAPYEAVPPARVKAFPELLRAQGYYTINRAKTDYQFGEPFTVWDENGGNADWTGRADGQPFFAMINFFQTHESFTWPPDDTHVHPAAEGNRARNARLDETKSVHTEPARIEVPPYYPQTDGVAENIARHYDNIALMDRMLGDLMDRIEAEGLLEKSIIIFTTDHGDGLPRAKRTVYDSGLAVPMIVRFPDGQGAGTVREDLISFVDLAPTILSLAEAPVPEWIQGRVVAGAQRDAPRDYIFAAADRLDEKPGRMKAARSERYKYIRNYRADLPRLPSLGYQNVNPIMQEWRDGLAAGTLNDLQASYLTAPSPAEELYDLAEDPYEVRNLAADPDHTAALETMRAAMNGWIDRTGDLSAMTEAEMVETMWPGGEQPVTAAPRACLSDEGLILTSGTDGASLGYRGKDADRWQLYHQPLEVAGTIEAKAVRYGYAESSVVIVDGGGLSPCR